MQRRARFHDVAVALEARIAEGEWPINQRLPSVRALAKEYDVAAATASRAFEHLRGKGLVRPDERSGVFRVADRSAMGVGTDQWAVCLRITPGPGHRGAMAIMRSGFDDPSNTAGIRLSFDAIPQELDMPVAKMRQLVADVRAAGATGLLFMPSRIDERLALEDERLLDACRKARFPVVLMDRYLRGEHPDLEWDLVAPDYADGGFRCATHLFETGRRSLAFVRASPSSSHNEMLTGFLMAHYHARRRGLLKTDDAFPIVYEFPETVGGRQAYGELCDKVIADGVDGVVCYQDRVVIGLALELLSRARRIPADVALTGFDNQPIGSEFGLGVTTYALPSREIARQAFQMMRRRQADPSLPPTKTLIPSQLIVRESTVESAPGNHRP